MGLIDLRLNFSLVFLCTALITVGFGYTVVSSPDKTYSFFSNLGNPEPLDKRKLVPFVPPKSAYKVAFPAEQPRELTEILQYTRQSPLPCPQYYVADKECAYYATSYPTLLDGVAPMSQGSKNYVVIASSEVNGHIPASKENSYVIYDPISVQNFLDTKSAGIMTKCNATASLNGPISAAGGKYPGRMIEGTFNNTKSAFRMRFYLDLQNSRIYSVAVVGDKKRVFSSQATKFLNSLEVWS